MGLRVDVLFPNPDISLGKLSPLEKGIGTCLLKKNSILKKRSLNFLLVYSQKILSSKEKLIFCNMKN